MTLDADFKVELDKYVKQIKDSKYLRNFAESMIDEHNEYGTEPEDMIGYFDAIEEDVMQVCRDYVHGIVHDAPNEVWKALCKELGKDLMIGYMAFDKDGENIVKKYYGKSYDAALDNDDEGKLLDVCVDMLIQLYVYEDWYDWVREAIYDEIVRQYYKIVGN